ncbi:hypothetical protein M409DRAFT_52019 [Zasmidium cellare ATCC 36951]|uniref:Chromatin remodeling factor mit1 n=1 Tax=Zasmidium cellare ATCC 36951 TaxID=1080233 RepID=A0A6A6CY41_ZASCE|nr:uncharacterized protein M409DRAFT_52019 [Zasmidium cellare ATCC 36951]KAF2170286.1 hypothetical protein M409DRAFT_52019 [Zasmidium cellare ATCC 36951]
MSFHFDARGDSSDDEDGGGLDLASWKTGAAAPRGCVRGGPVAPVARMVAADDEEDDDSQSGTPDLAAFQTGRKRKSPSATGSPPALSFQAINERLEESDEGSTYDLQSIDSDVLQLPMEVEEEDQPAPSGQELFVQISRSEVDRDDFEDYAAMGTAVKRVLQERQLRNGDMVYKVLFDDTHSEEIPFDELLRLNNGQEALNAFVPDAASDSEESPEPAPRAKRGRRGPAAKQSRMSARRPGSRRNPDGFGFVSTVDNVDGSDVDISDDDDEITVTRTRGGKRKQDTTQYEDQGDDEDDDDEPEGSEDELAQPTRSGLRKGRGGKAVGGRGRQTRASTGLGLVDDDEEEEEDSDGMNVLQSDLPGMKKRRKNKRSTNDDTIRVNMRQSERATRHVGDMQEVAEDDIFRSESEQERAPSKPKISLVREVFKPLPTNDDFRMRHYQWCDTCGQGKNYAQLIYCQGCSISYHKNCLGPRTNREHLVTKIADDEHVLQCRRCVKRAQKKDETAPDQSKCQDCLQPGAGCQPFRPRKSAAQEQKEREDNGGVDPNYPVIHELINNADNVLFRCMGCYRAFHFEHLPSLTDMMDLDGNADPEQRFREYSHEWKCKECKEMPAKVSGLIAWKPVDDDLYDNEAGFEGLNEQDKAYLVRWEGMSYFRAQWMPGPWVWGVTAIVMRKAFAKREDAQHPKMRTEDAIPEDYLRTDIVLDIKYTSYVDIRTEEVDKARIREVEKALIKYKGLSYEDAVWEAPPSPEDGERWSDFVLAYNDWVAGYYVRQPKPSQLKVKLEKIRKDKDDFQKLEKTEQPESMQGGKLMEYQVQGLNWLYYKWFQQKNAILADEMGLGKTIQIIGFLATLIQDHGCFPFLVVVPNSTCPNWRREIKRWAPGLRVVAFYGSRESREKAKQYELYPQGSKELKCHIVVTSYDTAADDDCRRFFQKIPWQGLIVDEGQRLKNDKNLLYAALGALKAPFKILLTGTPLQNNQRELFNLLHFLDDSYNPAELEKEYEDLDQEKIAKLHDMIRPFFLRRTKAQVLTFLPPMAQIILPVSMSLVQKKLYRSILAKNPDLMKAIFSTESATLKQGERASLSNILMQLRKCLCHPFVYNKGIEDRNVDIASSHRNLVDASSKLKLLELLLPKLRERGHRVLIFSQFLEMLDIVEDCLDGMQLRFQRLDGSINAMTKQKRIDEFNAPDSELFAFLLSTRAGGVGINLASADTVIILDPDFNPHQDIQALSRAHRIGQQKKVLCFQLVTRYSSEERIMQIGRKKLALDHVLIQEMNEDDADQNDLVSILRHGANELFEDNGEMDITYDAASVERLLDRSHMEDTKAGADKSAETQFSLARVWANDQGALEDANVQDAPDETAPNPGVWEHILKERERVAAEEAAAKAEAFGRGRRARANNIDYTTDKAQDDIDVTPVKRGKKRKQNDESDTDFQADDSDGDDDLDNGEMVENGELKDLHRGTKPDAGHKKTGKPSLSKTQKSPKKTPKKASVPKTSSSAKKSGANGKKVAQVEPAPKKPMSAAARKANPQARLSNFRVIPPSFNKASKRSTKTDMAVSQAILGNGKASASSMKKAAVPGAVTKAVDGEGSTKQKPIELDDSSSNKASTNTALTEAPTFRRVQVLRPGPVEPTPIEHPTQVASNGNATNGGTPQPPQFNQNGYPVGVNCRACQSFHAVGSCPLKLAGVEHCNLCGMAHYGHARVCPHIQSETQVRAMLEALKYSNEPEHLVKEANRYLRGLKGSLVQLKKQKEAKEAAAREAAFASQFQQPMGMQSMGEQQQLWL